MTRGTLEHFKNQAFIIKCYIYRIQKIKEDSETMFILIFIIEVDYCLRECAYVFVLDYLDYHNAP